MVAVTVPEFPPCDSTGQRTLSEGRALVWNGLHVFGGTSLAFTRTRLHSPGIWEASPGGVGKSSSLPPPPAPPFWSRVD